MCRGENKIAKCNFPLKKWSTVSTLTRTKDGPRKECCAGGEEKSGDDQICHSHHEQRCALLGKEKTAGGGRDKREREGAHLGTEFARESEQVLRSINQRLYVTLADVVKKNQECHFLTLKCNFRCQTRRRT